MVFAIVEESAPEIVLADRLVILLASEIGIIVFPNRSPLGFAWITGTMKAPFVLFKLVHS